MDLKSLLAPARERLSSINNKILQGKGTSPSTTPTQNALPQSATKIPEIQQGQENARINPTVLPEKQSPIESLVEWGKDEKSQDNPIEAATMSVEEFNGQQPEEESQQEPRTGTLLSGVFGEGTTAPVPEGRVARGDAQGPDAPLLMFEDDERFDTASNPLDKLLTDVLAANLTFGNSRSGPANENAEWSYRLGNKGSYTEEEIAEAFENPQMRIAQPGEEPDYVNLGWVLPDGSTLSDEDMSNVQAGQYHQAAQGEAAHGQMEDGTPYVLETLILPDGREVSYNDYMQATEYNLPGDQAPEGQGTGFVFSYTLPNGVEITEEDLISEESGGPLVAEQTNKGRLNMGAAQPSAPWEDITDFFPWMYDTAAHSAPYFVPGYNALSAASRFAPAQEGFDPDTFDPSTYTYEDRTLDSDQWVGEMGAPLADYFMEKVGGIVPGGGYGKLAQARTAPGRIAKTAVEEGFEEIPASLFEMLSDDGFANYGKNSIIDPETGERIYLDTSDQDRLGNIGYNAAEGFGGGAIFGGILGGGKEAGRGIRNNMKKNKYVPPQQTTTLPQEQLNRINELLLEQANNKPE